MILRKKLEMTHRFTVVTGEETWFYGYDREIKQASSQWKTPNSPKTKEGPTGSIKC